MMRLTINISGCKQTILTDAKVVDSNLVWSALFLIENYEKIIFKLF